MICTLISRNIRRLFGSLLYVGVEKLERNPMKQMRTITTIMTVDIRNFTYHSSHADQRLRNDEDFIRKNETVCEFARQFHDLTLGVIRTFDPKVEALVISTGDGVIVGFRGENHATRALKCAITLQSEYLAAFKQVNADIAEKRQESALDFGIGMHTGSVDLKFYKDYHNPYVMLPLMLGEPVNISTKMEALTKVHPESNILFSETTHEEADPAVLGSNIIDFHVHNIGGFGAIHVYGLTRLS